jgi:hypothetical protein
VTICSCGDHTHNASGRCDTCEAIPRRWQPVTHACRWDEPGRMKVRALCGILIRRREHTNDPTCVTCQRELAAHETADPRDLADR